MIYNANASWNYRIAAQRIGLEWIASNVDLGIPKKKYYKTLNNAQSHKLLTTAARVGQVVVRGCGERGVEREAVRVRVCQSDDAHARAERLIQNFVGLHLRAIEQQSINRNNRQPIGSINRYTSVHAPRLQKLTPLAFHFQFRFWFRFRFQFLSFILRLYEKPVFIANNMICKSRGSANFTYYLFNWLYQLSMQPLTTCIWI